MVIRIDPSQVIRKGQSLTNAFASFCRNVCDLGHTVNIYPLVSTFDPGCL